MSQLTSLQTTVTKDASYFTSSYDLSSNDKFVIILDVSNVSGTNPYIEVRLQHSMDNSDFKYLYDDFGIGNFKRITDKNFSNYGKQALFINQFGKYVRADVRINGEITFSLKALAY